MTNYRARFIDQKMEEKRQAAKGQTSAVSFSKIPNLIYDDSSWTINFSRVKQRYRQLRHPKSSHQQTDPPYNRT